MPGHDYEQEHEHDGLRREPASFNRDPAGSAWLVQASLRALPAGSRLNDAAFGRNQRAQTYRIQNWRS